MAIEGFFPWHRDIAHDWLKNQDRFAHAWLIHGLTGIGKREFAITAAKSLLCEAPIDGVACGQCLACGWVQRGNHPDLKRIRPEVVAVEEGAEQETDEDAVGEVSGSESVSASKRAPSKDIRIDQIRSLEPWFNNATHRGGWRVALIYPAEALTVISANALLKVLEEPPPSTVFLIVADAPDRLLPTLLSRCRRLPLPTPALDTAQKWLIDQGVKQADLWLASCGGAPVLAKKRSESGEKPCPEWLEGFIQALSKGTTPDIGQIADQISKLPTASWIDPLQRLAVDAQLMTHGLSVRYFKSLAPAIKGALGPGGASAISDLSGWLNEQQKVASHPLNPKLFAHAVLQRFATTLLRARINKN